MYKRMGKEIFAIKNYRDQIIILYSLRKGQKPLRYFLPILGIYVNIGWRYWRKTRTAAKHRRSSRAAAGGDPAAAV